MTGTAGQHEALRLKRLAYQVRDADPHRRVFYSEGHGYEFESKLQEVEIADFEKRYGIRLPDDYRGFIQFAGNGGAGPGYGLCQVRQQKRTSLRSPFLTETREDATTRKPREFGHVLSGCLTLCEHGCGAADYLVLNGPHVGTVWAGNGDNYEGVLAFDSFTAWYQGWAERALRLLSRDRLLDGVKVGQPLAELVRLLGPVERTWGEDPNRGERYVSFRNLSASIRLGAGDNLAEVIRLGIH